MKEHSEILIEGMVCLAKELKAKIEEVTIENMDRSDEVSSLLTYVLNNCDRTAFINELNSESFWHIKDEIKEDWVRYFEESP